MWSIVKQCDGRKKTDDCIQSEAVTNYTEIVLNIIERMGGVRPEDVADSSWKERWR